MGVHIKRGATAKFAKLTQLGLEAHPYCNQSSKHKQTTQHHNTKNTARSIIVLSGVSISPALSLIIQQIQIKMYSLKKTILNILIGIAAVGVATADDTSSDAPPLA